MAAKEQPTALDITDGFFSYKTPHELATAIYSKVKDDLLVKLDAFMEEVKQELENKDTTELAGLFLSILFNKDLGPQALLLRRCLEQAVEATREMEDLLYIAQNINKGSIMYKLNETQLKRFGFTDKTTTEV